MYISQDNLWEIPDVLSLESFLLIKLQLNKNNTNHVTCTWPKWKISQMKIFVIANTCHNFLNNRKNKKLNLFFLLFNMNLKKHCLLYSHFGRLLSIVSCSLLYIISPETYIIIPILFLFFRFLFRLWHPNNPKILRLNYWFLFLQTQRLFSDPSFSFFKNTCDILFYL